MPLAGKQKVLRHPSKRALAAISEALKEIEAYFEMNGFSASEEESSVEVEELPEEEPEEEEVEEDEEADEGEAQGEGEEEQGDVDEDEGSGGVVFDREDVEVAIDCFISELVKEKVIRKPKPRQHPTLAQIFERVFGEDHPINELVQNFEEHIEGYFGAIGYDEMNSAYGELVGIREMINKEMG